MQDKLLRQEAEFGDLLTETRILSTRVDSLLARMKSTECECCMTKVLGTAEEPDTEP